MNFIFKRGNRLYYNRRVPQELRDYDKREIVRISLKTNNMVEASKRAEKINNELEAFWNGLLISPGTVNFDQHKQAIAISKSWGVPYITIDKLAGSALDVILARVEALEDGNADVTASRALLGTATSPELKLQTALEYFWDFAKDRIINKSTDQIRKWENPRKKAVKNFVALNGDKNLLEISRFDLLNLRDWWIDRIQNDGLRPGSANKDFHHLKNMLETIEDNMKIGLNVIDLFNRLSLKDKWHQTRLPFKTGHIINTLLNTDNLSGLDDEEKYFLYACADTGARGTEVVGLEEEHIILDQPIPHIRIRPKKNKELKTQHSSRDIPLVGFALQAFKVFPKGFIKYKDKPDQISTSVNKYLREKNLFPSDQHSVYSLRHSFQDRLTALDAPDRIQAELMGHQFSRPKYGDGPTLELKSEWMEKVKLIT